jgi:protein-tyrosine phosphatase
VRRTDGPFPVWEILPGQLFQSAKLHGRPRQSKWDGIGHYRLTRLYALAPTTADPDLAEWPDLYTHTPIPDGLLPEVGAMSLLRISTELAAHIRAGGTVLTMCNAGRNRSGLLSALIVRELSGIPGSAAMEVVRCHRPRAIANPNFERFLEGLE